MKSIRISINLLKLQGAVVTTLPNYKGGKDYYVSVPADLLYVPQNAVGQAHLLAQMVETPNNQFADFAVKPYVSPQEYRNMSDEQRRAIGFIGTGKYQKDQLPTGLTASAVPASVDLSPAQLPANESPEDANSNMAPFPDEVGTRNNRGKKSKKETEDVPF